VNNAVAAAGTEVKTQDIAKLNKKGHPISLLSDNCPPLGLPVLTEHFFALRALGKFSGLEPDF